MKCEDYIAKDHSLFFLSFELESFLKKKKAVFIEVFSDVS